MKIDVNDIDASIQCILIIIIKHGSIYFHLALANKFITHTVYIIQCIYHAKVKPKQIKNHSMYKKT